MKYLIEIHHGYGDVVQMTTAVEYLRNYDKEAIIDLILEKPFYRDLFKNDDRIHDFFYIDLTQKNRIRIIAKELMKIRKNKYDYYFVSSLSNKRASIVLSFLIRARRIIGEQFCEIGKISHKYQHVSTNERHMAEHNYNLVRSCIGDGDFFYPSLRKYNCKKEKMIGFAIGSSNEKKNWPTNILKKVGDYFISKGYIVLLLGGENEKTILRNSGIDITSYRNLVGKTSLSDIVELTQKCEIVIGCDTGIMHIASAVGTKTLTIFGASNPYIFSPYSEDSYVLELREKLDCQYCFDIDPMAKCENGFSCMQSIKPEDIIDLAIKILSESKGIDRYRVVGGYASRYDR